MLRAILTGIVSFALLPAVLLVDAVQTTRFERLRRGAFARVEVAGSTVRAGDQALERGNVVRVRRWSHERSTMASGPEELTVLEVELRDARRLRFIEPASDVVAAALGGEHETRPMGRSGGLRALALLVWCAVVAATVVAARWS